MKTIYKYSLCENIHHNSVYEIEIPKAAKILSVQMQGNVPVIWAIVNPKHPLRKRVFHVFGTGFEMDDYDKKHYEYITTIQETLATSTFAWHIFEVHE